MFQRDALTFRELESIQMQKMPHKASEELLQILLLLPEDATTALDCFLETLKFTNQQHIFLWLMYPGKIEEVYAIFHSVVIDMRKNVFVIQKNLNHLP
jgi:hypothetical protein